MESSSRLRPSRQRASGASCSTLRAHPPCAAAVRLFRRGRRKKGEKRRDFETRSLGDGRDTFARRVTRHWHDMSRHVASRLLAFTRSTETRTRYRRRARYRRDDSSGSRAVTPRATPSGARCARAACAAPSFAAQGETISQWRSRRGGSSVRGPPSNKIDRLASFVPHPDTFYIKK